MTSFDSRGCGMILSGNVHYCRIRLSAEGLFINARGDTDGGFILIDFQMTFDTLKGFPHFPPTD